MRILSFSHDGNLYGAQRSLLGLLRGLRRRGHEVQLVLPESGDLSGAAEDEEIPVRVICYPYPSTRPLRAIHFLRCYPRAARKIRKLVEDSAPDIVHFNTAACFAPAAALKKAKIARLWHIREAAPLRRVLSKYIRRWSNAIIFNCSHIAEVYPSLKDLASSAVVHNGLDIQRPSADEINAVRNEFGWTESNVVVTFAGQLRPHKDPLAVVEAIAIARRQNVALRACISGEGPLLSQLKRAVERLKIEEYVSLPGFRSDSLAILAASDIVVCPSLVEPFPRVALEAMALGLPVIATEVGGIPEMVADGETGLLFPAGDREAFADALCTLGKDKEKRKELGLAGSVRHRTFFSEDSYAIGVEQVINKLLAGKSASG